MGHDVIQCPICGAWIMEGHMDWKCDRCDFYMDADINPARQPSPDKETDEELNHYVR